MGTIAYVRQVYDDTAWYAQAEPIYEAKSHEIAKGLRTTAPKWR